MKEQDIMMEIEQLKQQLNALGVDKGRTTEAAAEGPGDRSQASGAGEDPGSWMRELLKQAEELIGGLDLQFKDVPAKTALIIFALGVLTGRLLSRRG
jgi:hypothetical protein